MHVRSETPRDQSAPLDHKQRCRCRVSGRSRRSKDLETLLNPGVISRRSRVLCCSRRKNLSNYLQLMFRVSKGSQPRRPRFSADALRSRSRSHQGTGAIRPTVDPGHLQRGRFDPGTHPSAHLRPGVEPTTGSPLPRATYTTSSGSSDRAPTPPGFGETEHRHKQVCTILVGCLYIYIQQV